MPERTIKTKYFAFCQNNSGGKYVIDENFDQYVIVEAQKADEAYEKLMELGGCNHGWCGCCGERWSSWIDDEDGTDSPEIYGKPASELKTDWITKDIDCVIIHHYDGTKTRPNAKQPTPAA